MSTTNNNNFGPNVMNLMGGAFYKGLSIMSQYQMQMQKNQLELFQDEAKEQSEIVGDYLETAEDSARELGQSLTYEAIGTLSGGVMDLAGVGVGLGAESLSANTSAETELKNAKLLKTALTSDDNKPDLKLMDLSPTEDTQLKERIQNLKDGKFANFDLKDPVNQNAIAHLKVAGQAEPAAGEPDSSKAPSQLKPVVKALDSYIGQLDEQVTAGQRAGEARSNKILQSFSGVGKGAQAGAQMVQAQVQQESQIDKARADVIQTTDQQWLNALNNAEQAAAQAGQASLETAALFGQITQTHA